MEKFIFILFTLIYIRISYKCTELFWQKYCCFQPCWQWIVPPVTVNRELEYGFDNDTNACKKKGRWRCEKGRYFTKVPQNVFAKPQYYKEWVDVHKRRRKCHMKGNKNRAWIISKGGSEVRKMKNSNDILLKCRVWYGFVKENAG